MNPALFVIRLTQVVISFDAKKKPKKIRGLFLAFRLRYAFQVLQQETTCSCKTENQLNNIRFTDIVIFTKTI